MKGFNINDIILSGLLTGNSFTFSLSSVNINDNIYNLESYAYYSNYKDNVWIHITYIINNGRLSIFLNS